jgi:hypothetical protein
VLVREQSKLFVQILPMNLFVLLSLVLYVFFDCFLVSVSANGVHVKPTGPEMASPEDFLDLGMQTKHFFGGNGLRCFYNLGWCHHGHGLDEEMDMIFVRSDLDVIKFVALFDFIANVLEGLFVILRKDLPAVFGGANQVVEKKSDVMTLVNVLAAHGESLPCFTRSIALEERGTNPGRIECVVCIDPSSC